MAETLLNGLRVLELPGLGGACGAFLASLGADAAPLTAILIGLCMGAEGDVIAYLTARYFGLASYGQLYGAYTVGLGSGAFVPALLNGAFHSYGPPLWIAGGVLLVGGALLATAPRFETAR